MRWRKGGISNNTGATKGDSNSFRTKNFIPILNSTEYIISNNGEGISCNVFEYSNDYSFIKYSLVNANNPFTTTENTAYVKFAKYNRGEDKLQLEEGNEISPYEPYYNYKLAGKDEYKDLFFKNEKSNPNYNTELDEGAWYKLQNIDKYVYNNDLQTNSIDENKVQMLTPVLNIEENLTASVIVALCNIISPGVSNYTGLIGTTGTNKIRVQMSTDYVSSYDEFKALCLEKGLTIYFKNKVPTYTKIPKDITLYNQLEELNKYIGQGGTIVIETESEEENAQLIVKASALASFENS